VFLFLIGFVLQPRVRDMGKAAFRGHLLKKSSILGRWLQYWFVKPEDGDFLYYFEDNDPETCIKGVICLPGATVSWEGPEGYYSFMFTIGVDLPRRPASSEATSIYSLRAENLDDFNGWATALNDTGAKFTDSFGRPRRRHSRQWVAMTQQMYEPVYEPGGLVDRR